MIAHQVMQQAISRLHAFQPGKAAQHALASVIRQADAPILQLAYELALHSGLNHNDALSRCHALLLQHCAIHLADDLADGDCDYLNQPYQQGTTALFSLQQAFALALCELPLSSGTRETLHRDLLAVGLAQHAELSTSRHALEQAMYLASDLNGKQFRAYFMLCSDAGQQDTMGAMGYAFGVCNHVANDIRSRDTRYTSLTTDEQQQLRQWSREYLQKIWHSGIPTLRQQAQLFARFLG